MIKGVFFDLDGTLLDTDKLIFMSYVYLFDKFLPDYHLTIKELLSFLGPSLHETLPKYFDQDVEYLIEQYREFNVANHRKYVLPFMGAKEVLQTLKEKQFKVAVVTSKRSDVAKFGLELFDLDKYVDYIVGCDNVEKLKPSPEGIHLAMKYLDLKSDEIIMIGDSKGDILAGKSANCLTVAVSYSIKGDYFSDLKPNWVIDELKEIIKIVEVK